jgi:hypothetical protein
MELEQGRFSTDLEDGEKFLARQMVAEKASKDVPEDVSTSAVLPSVSIRNGAHAPISVAEFDATLVNDEALLVKLYHMSIIYNLALVHCRLGNLTEANQLLHLSLELAAAENDNDNCNIGFDGGDNTYGV